MKEKFKVEFLEDAMEFIDKLDPKAREKILYNIHKAKFVNDNELFKKLTDEIWEFRTLYKKTAYRLFAFWDTTQKTNTIVISTHGLIKKTHKTPSGEIDKAERIRKEYFKTKKLK